MVFASHFHSHRILTSVRGTWPPRTILSTCRTPDTFCLRENDHILTTALSKYPYIHDKELDSKGYRKKHLWAIEAIDNHDTFPELKDLRPIPGHRGVVCDTLAVGPLARHHRGSSRLQLLTRRCLHEHGGSKLQSVQNNLFTITFYNVLESERKGVIVTIRIEISQKSKHLHVHVGWFVECRNTNCGNTAPFLT